MGRHSAPDDDDEADVPVVVAADPGAARRGRHTRGEDVEDTGPVPGTEMRAAEARAAAQDDQPTERIPLDELLAEPVDVEVTAPTEPVPVPEPKGKAKGKPRRPQSTAADLALLRRRADVRNRVLGAVLVPFVLYVAVLVVVGARGVQYLLWIWIPLVSAGVLAGLILDAAQRDVAPPTEPAEPEPEPEAPAEPEPPAEPAEPNEPAESEAPNEPDEPSEPAEPNAATEPAEPSTATEPEAPPAPPDHAG